MHAPGRVAQECNATPDFEIKAASRSCRGEGPGVTCEPSFAACPVA